MNEIPEPGWNSSTMCLHVLHRTMTDQGWGDWRPPIPLCDYEFPRIEFELELDLPRRPHDLGVGLWR